MFSSLFFVFFGVCLPLTRSITIENIWKACFCLVYLIHLLCATAKAFGGNGNVWSWLLKCYHIISNLLCFLLFFHRKLQIQFPFKPIINNRKVIASFMLCICNLWEDFFFFFSFSNKRAHIIFGYVKQFSLYEHDSSYQMLWLFDSTNSFWNNIEKYKEIFCLSACLLVKAKKEKKIEFYQKMENYS